MIESAYWKTELFAAADAIEEQQDCIRWTEKRAVMLEREIMIAMFCVRSLIERSKVSNSLVQKQLPVISFPVRPGKIVHRLNCWDIDELYDLDDSVKQQLTLQLLTNQVIHSYIIFPRKNVEKRMFTHLLVCSDFERNKQLFQISIEDVVAIIREVAFDSPSKMHLEFNGDMKDYKITQSS